MTEYIIIVSMVAIAAIVIFQLFGRTIRETTGKIIESLSGGEPVATQQQKVNPDQGLDDFFKAKK